MVLAKQLAKMLQNTVAALHGIGHAYGPLTRPSPNRERAKNNSPSAANLWGPVQTGSRKKADLAVAQVLLTVKQLTTLLWQVRYHHNRALPPPANNTDPVNSSAIASPTPTPTNAPTNTNIAASSSTLFSL
jgi:hypothetical protein